MCELKHLLDEIRHLGPGIPNWQLKKSNLERRLKRLWFYDWVLVAGAQRYLGKKRSDLLSLYMSKMPDKEEEK